MMIIFLTVKWTVMLAIIFFGAPKNISCFNITVSVIYGFGMGLGGGGHENGIGSRNKTGLKNPRKKAL